MFINIHDSNWPVSVFERFTIKNLRFKKNAQTRSNFELEKCFFLMGWILPEIYRYHYQGDSLAPTCIVHSPASNTDKYPCELSVTSDPSGGGPKDPQQYFGLFGFFMTPTMNVDPYTFFL